MRLLPPGQGEFFCVHDLEPLDEEGDQAWIHRLRRVDTYAGTNILAVNVRMYPRAPAFDTSVARKPRLCMCVCVCVCVCVLFRMLHVAARARSQTRNMRCVWGLNNLPLRFTSGHAHEHD
jgi:hypothetical protein